MELTFTKNLNNEFVAEFEATADFNLHVENILPRDITLLQRTAGGKYDVIHDFPQNPPLSNIMDYDFTALIYPKTIKVVCAKEPTYAAVVSDGEVTEIKSQSKEIEVTANGTTVVEPDAGFAYLNKVSVKTNVEGAGGGSEGGENTYIYRDIRGADQETRQGLSAVSMLVKIKANSMDTIITVPYTALDMLHFSTACCYDPTIKISPFKTGEFMTIDEFMAVVGVDFSSCPQITEEEFYTL